MSYSQYTIEPSQLVEPRIATNATRWIFFSSASRPFGMVNLSPDTTREGDWGAGYCYSDKRIQAFSHVHAWQISALPMMPTQGAFLGTAGLDEWESDFDHKHEIAKPGYHKVVLPKLCATVELTSTIRAGLTRVTFERAGQGYLNFDLGATLGPCKMGEASIKRVSENAVEGYVTNLPTRRRPKPLKVYFIACVNIETPDICFWKEGSIASPETCLTGNKLGFSFGKKITSGQSILLKVGLSYTSIEQARKNLDTELPDFNFERVKEESRTAWNAMLGRIKVEGGNKNRQIKFYTDLFHALQGRRIVSDVDGKYFDYTTSEPRICQTPSGTDGKPLHEHYNSDAMWGAQWSVNQLWPLAYPEITSGFCNSFINMYRDGGLIPRGPSGGNYTFVMTGASSTPLFVSAWQKGIRDFDPETAFYGLKKNHLPGGLMSKAGYEHNTCLGGGLEYYIERGYVPLGIKADAYHCCGATQTLEYAFEDWALGQFAQSLSNTGDAISFKKRAENYKNLWNSENGFLQPRLMNGDWLPDYDPMQPEGWVEGNGWQYLFRATHDIDNLAELMGGQEAAIQRLDALMRLAADSGFVAPHGEHHLSPLDYGNQPSTFYAHIFNHLGAPERSQFWTREIYHACKSDITPVGGYGGDEDQGLMGALNCLFAIGLFDINGGCGSAPGYYLCTPIFEKIEIKLSSKYYSGNILTVRTDQSPENCRYIKSASLNGAPINNLWVQHNELMKGATIDLAISS